MLLNLMALVIVAVCLASLRHEGLWSNTLRLVNVILAGLVASGYFEPLATILRSLAPSYTYFCDFAALWALFAIGVMVLCWITDRLSRYRLRLPAIFDRVGGALLSVIIGWVVVCFTFMTLHTAPLCEQFLFGQFQPRARMVLGSGPDRMWLGFVRYVAGGPLSRSRSATPDAPLPPLLDSADAFVEHYAEHRAKLERHASQTGSVVVDR